MKVNFVKPAQEELFEAVTWYENRQVRLGLRFKKEIETVSRQIAIHPFLFREQRGGYRRINCPVFPYYLPYVIRGEEIFILAVAHAHRRPVYWKSRITETRP